jgi:adenylyltransferase/sulfurtransferase
MPDAGSSPTCDTAGVIMPIIATVSATQVAEALKLLVGDVDSLHGSLMQFDMWANDRQRIKLGEPNADCKCCGQNIYEFLDAETQEFSAVLCGRNAVQIAPSIKTKLDLEALAQRLQFSVAVNVNDYLLRFTFGEHEMTVFRDGRAIVKGTDDLTVARSLYSRFIGS